MLNEKTAVAMIGACLVACSGGQGQEEGRVADDSEAMHSPQPTSCVNTANVSTCWYPDGSCQKAVTCPNSANPGTYITIIGPCSDPIWCSSS